MNFISSVIYFFHFPAAAVVSALHGKQEEEHDQDADRQRDRRAHRKITRCCLDPGRDQVSNA